jgi:hypothetical protein
MEKLTEFVTNSFTDTREIKFFGKSSPKSEPRSPRVIIQGNFINGHNDASSGQEEEEEGEEDTDGEQLQDLRRDKKSSDDSINNNNDADLEKGKRSRGDLISSGKNTKSYI